jgi:hypothetical protein
MPEPVSTLSTEYSDPTAVAVDWERTRAALAAAELFWLSTVRADGRPHVTPVVAVWAQDAVWFTTGTNEVKFANLATNPQVVLTTGCNAWDGGLDVVVEGAAVRANDDVVLGRVAAAFARKWDGRWQYVAAGGAFLDADRQVTTPVFSVRPVKVFAHAKGDPFGATRHRFAPAGPGA